MTAVSVALPALTLAPAPFAIRAEQVSDVAARERLLDSCFGTNRQARTCQRLRDGRLPAEGLAFVSEHLGRINGTLRLWRVSAGGVPALMLGPLAVEADSRALGVGAALMRHAIDEAAARGHAAIVLLGDAPYYARFGFEAAKAASLALPGPFERDRLLGLELTPAALSGAAGMIVATGAKAPAIRKPRLRRAA
jgi:predicted N-acetyltransferase YhbS